MLFFDSQLNDPFNSILTFELTILPLEKTQ